MKTFETEHHHVFESMDDRGTFQFRIHKDLDQIQIETEMEDDFGSNSEYIDVNKDDLIAIRNLIDKALLKDR